MFRIRKHSVSDKFSHEARSGFSGRLAAIGLSAVLGLGLLVAPVQVQPVEAGQGKTSMGKITKKRISGHSKARGSTMRMTSGKSVSSGRRISARDLGGQTKRGGKRIYTRRHSVLDGNGPVRVSGRQLHHRPVRVSGRSNNIRHYAKGRLVKRRLQARGSRERIYSSRVAIDPAIDLSAGSARSGVKYVRRNHVGFGTRHGSGIRHYGMRELAGASNTRVVRRRLEGTSTQNPGTGSGHGHNRHGGLVILGVTSATSLEPVAGHAPTGHANDCDYGTYCTIDLGGPKIITFNDAGDIRGGELVDGQYNEDEGYDEYGGK